MDKEQWIQLGKKRILNILDRYRVSTIRHLEIKISEAGPYNQRVQPALLSPAYRELKKEGRIKTLEAGTTGIDLVGPADFGKRGDASILQKFVRLYKLHREYASIDDMCGFQLEKLLYDTALQLRDTYTIYGAGPIEIDGILKKPSGFEVTAYNGNLSYTGSGLDLFVVDKETSVPIGIEAKNTREWIYPASYEVWRMLAKACTLQCLPVLAARKISYITRKGFFKNVGILGFETQFQFFNPRVIAASNKTFERVSQKTGLGYADIKITNDVPPYFIQFFKNTLPANAEEYFKRFMRHKDILKKYAIDKELGAHNNTPAWRRHQIYREFKEEIGMEDPENFHVQGKE